MTPEHKPSGRAAAGPDAALQDKNAASGAQDHKDKAEAKDINMYLGQYNLAAHDIAE